MSAEGGIAAVLLKYLWMLVSAVFGFLFVWMFKRTNNTYTKEEADKVMDYKLATCIDSLNHYANTQQKLADSIDRQTEVYSALKIDFVRMEGKMDNVVSNMDNLKRQVDKS